MEEQKGGIRETKGMKWDERGIVNEMGDRRREVSRMQEESKQARLVMEEEERDTGELQEGKWEEGKDI